MICGEHVGAYSPQLCQWRNRPTKVGLFFLADKRNRKIECNFEEESYMKTSKLLSFILAAVMILALVPTTSFAQGTPVVEVYGITEITKQGNGDDSVYTFPFDGVVIIKQGGNLWVWTADELSDAVKAAMRTVLEELIDDSNQQLFGAGTIKGFVHGTEFTIEKTNGEEPELKLNENKLVAEKSDLAKLFAGSYTVTYPVEYHWVLKSQKEDSSTGFISVNDKQIGNSWFRMQNITLPDEGKNISIAINSGNPKNGATIVGKITIANVGGNRYEVAFDFENQELPANPVEGQTGKMIAADSTVHWNYTGSGTAFNKAPGQNLKGSISGVSFTSAQKTIDFFAHFSIITYTYVYERVEAE